jgi:hypothetical protein
VVSTISLLIGYELLVSAAATVGLSILAAYYSFAICIASKESVYRRRAMFTGLLAAGLAILVLTTLLAGGSPTNPNALAQLGLFVYFIILAVWTDSAIRTAIDQDFFHRNTLYWSSVRYPFLVFTGIVTPFLVLATLTVEGLLVILVEASFILSIALIAVGITALFVSGTRTKDRLIRNYLKWFGFAVVSFLFQFIFPLDFPFSLKAAIPVALTAYFLLKMARSLSPVSKFEVEDMGNFTLRKDTPAGSQTTL